MLDSASDRTLDVTTGADRQDHVVRNGRTRRRRVIDQLGSGIFARCRKVGQLMMEQAPFMTGRWFGFLVLRISGDAKPADVPAIREIAWRYEQFFPRVQSSPEEAERRALLANLVSSGNDKAIVTDRLHRAGVSLTPPPTWKWMRDGKSVDMLTDSSKR
jgi:hypothetical protein